MAIPAKLASLLLRTVAKPIAARLKERAQGTESFRTFCISMGRFVNRTSMQMQILASGHIPREIKPLSEKKAINRGADFLGEAIIFSVGGAVIVAEVTRSSRAAEEKAEAERERKRQEQAVRAPVRTRPTSSPPHCVPDDARPAHARGWGVQDMEQRFRATELKLLALQDDLKRVERLARLACEAQAAGGRGKGNSLEAGAGDDAQSSNRSSVETWLWPIHRYLWA